MSYATNDFIETLSLAGIAPHDCRGVVAAWGRGNANTGTDGWSDDAGTEWSGGFVIALADGAYVYVTGWCDYTGWGCQDGVDVARFDHCPTHEEVAAVNASRGYIYETEPIVWDQEPSDLNRWLRLSRNEPS